jgi:hypothetical protein
MSPPRLNQFEPRHPEEGSALVEFVLCMALLIIPFLLGTAVLGLNVIREIQVTELCRDATHMYSQGIDFTQSSYQTELNKIAQGLNLSTNGIVILSTITYVDQAACEEVYGSNYSSQCTNLNKTVFTRQVTIGNTALRVSSWGTPPVDTSNSDNVSQTNQLTNTSARAVDSNGNNFSLITVNASTQFAYVGEVYFKSPDLSWWSSLGNTAISARFVF